MDIADLYGKLIKPRFQEGELALNEEFQKYVGGKGFPRVLDTQLYERRVMLKRQKLALEQPPMAETASENDEQEAAQA